MNGGDGRRLDPAYPSGKTLKTPLGPLEVYEDATSIRFVLPAAVEDSSGSVVIQAEVQACDDSGICLPPETLDLALYF